MPAFRRAACCKAKRTSRCGRKSESQEGPAAAFAGGLIGAQMTWSCGRQCVEVWPRCSPGAASKLSSQCTRREQGGQIRHKESTRLFWPGGEEYKTGGGRSWCVAVQKTNQDRKRRRESDSGSVVAVECTDMLSSRQIGRRAATWQRERNRLNGEGMPEPRTTAMADTQAARERRAVDRARIVDIAARIIDLECSIRALRVEKEMLEAEQETLQEHLDAYTYPVLTLPPEIVSEIFVRFLPVYPERAPQKGLLSPITLGQICRLWREMAFSTPRLWRTFTIFLRLGDSVQNYDADHPRIETSLQRSGSCPLSVQYMRSDTSSLFRLIIAHRARWEHLKLFVSVRNLPAIIGPFPLLRTLTTNVWVPRAHDKTYRPPTFHTAPLLRRVAISNYKDIFLGMLPWSQLTVLIIKSIEINPCIRVLALAPLLVYSDLTFSRHGEGDTEDDMPRSVKAPTPTYTDLNIPSSGLAHMKHLKLRGPRQLLNPLSVLTLPALQRLHVDEASLQPDPMATLRFLLSRWGSSPQEIHIGLPALRVHLYSTALPSIVFSSARRPPLPIRFLEPQPTTLVGLEAMNIDEEGDWDEVSSSESEESDSSDSGEESTSDSSEKSTSESGEESDTQEGDIEDYSE
ncbi:hypothetical protein B0H16DRAFT_1701418 [Mycena metata]|uniref:F-box domain-containing protein n=1 Tax=Mycena metata TaxID=1033252 RepID=A0AAD7HBG4_9AGAR|nr:hypothetical protein B0H16DRAFT_1701418 [Mycena metata]